MAEGRRTAERHSVAAYSKDSVDKAGQRIMAWVLSGMVKPEARITLPAALELAEQITILIPCLLSRLKLDPPSAGNQDPLV
jgi:hypothetical protein